jgi:transcriptional regulator with XRE-family HTH domain
VADYSLEALGQIVKRLRREQGLTQEELGNAADYGKGAGVSISRLENGRLEPSHDRLVGIASALGVSTHELEERAADETTARQIQAQDGNPTQEERISAIIRESDRRQQLHEELKLLAVARDRANDDFLMKFRATAARVVYAPSPDSADLAKGDAAQDNDEDTEAAYQIRFTRYGVERALAGGTADPIDYADFTEAVALGAAAAGAAALGASSLGDTARKGFLTAVGLGRRGSRAVGTANGVGLAALFGVGVVAAALLDRQLNTKRTRRRQESAAKLAAAEDEIAQNQPNVEALLDAIPRATDTFDYIAVHAAHALARWESQIPEGSVAWEELGQPQQERYREFVDIAAAQLAIATIDLQELATSRDGELEQASALADQVLIQSRRTITSRV